MNSKEYQEQKSHSLTASEPEIMYASQTDLSFEEEFNRAAATAITGDEFRRRMYKRIQAWPWEELSSIQTK
ncbi:hypothetical protein AGMMS50262_15420 [Bacteroidia bacterium]|nr:hypothetical protein AGMMS50262_15420 [Bacteroidia bacterium]